MDNNELLDNLKLIVGDTQVRTGEPMNIHTTFRIGGCADYYVQPSSIEELQSLIRFLNKSDIVSRPVIYNNLICDCYNSNNHNEHIHVSVYSFIIP